MPSSPAFSSGFPSPFRCGGHRLPLARHDRFPFLRSVERRRELERLRYRYRGDDQIEEIASSSLGARVFEHDARGRLVRERRGERVLERAMDAVGNVYRSARMSDRRYEPGGKLVEDAGTRYEHDERGNRVRELHADGTETRYRWNGHGLLTEVTRPDGVRVAFDYDPFARRIAKRVHRPDGAVERERRYVWDGNTVVHELDSLEGLTTHYFEPGSFAPLAKERNGKRWYIATDHLDTPTEVYDEAAELAWRAQLDVFGVRHDDVRGEAPPTGFPGQYEDEDAGLTYNRHRWYDPRAGRYISPDPIGTSGGLSIYSYVDDPLSWTDPVGLSACRRDPGLAQAMGDPYEGARAASAWLKSIGVSRRERKEILDSFVRGTIRFYRAGPAEYGVRFAGGKARAVGQYLFPAFSPQTGRVGLALPHIWGNTMSSVHSFQIAPGTPIIRGITGPAAAQYGPWWRGGEVQMFVFRPWRDGSLL